MPMRASIFAIFAVLAAPPAAFADQTDARLDPLFEELRTGDARDADATVERIEAIWADSQSDTVDVLYERASAAAAVGALDLASALLDHAIGLAPSFAQAYALRGSVRLRLDDQVGSIADFTRTIELEPRQFDASIALGEIMLAGGDKHGANAMFQKALEWNPHEEHARERARKLRAQIEGQEI